MWKVGSPAFGKQLRQCDGKARRGDDQEDQDHPGIDRKTAGAAEPHGGHDEDDEPNWIEPVEIELADGGGDVDGDGEAEAGAVGPALKTVATEGETVGEENAGEEENQR